MNDVFFTISIIGLVIFWIVSWVVTSMILEINKSKQKALIGRTIKLSPAYRKANNIKDLYANVYNVCDKTNEWTIQVLPSQDTIKKAKKEYDEQYNAEMDRCKKENKIYDLAIKMAKK